MAFYDMIADTAPTSLDTANDASQDAAHINMTLTLRIMPCKWHWPPKSSKKTSRMPFHNICAQ